MTRLKLTLAYDGTRYDGWQRQGNTANTIQARVETLLSRTLERPVEIHGCGRTDAGVHARMQVCHFDVPDGTDVRGLLAALRRYLPEDIAARALEEADPRFHARLSCREKTYVYRVNTGETQDVFARKYELFLPGPLDEAAMAEAARALTGTHDYRAFTGNHRTKMTGTLLEVGQGRRRPEETAAALASLDRQQAGPMAPAQGLTLWSVKYD